MAIDNSALPFLEALTEGADLVAFTYDVAANRFLYLNPAFEKIWCRTRKSIIQNPAAILKTIHPDDKEHLQQVYQELLDGTLLQSVKFRIKLPNKTERSLCLKPQLLPEQNAIVGFAEDTTARQEHTDNLQKFSNKKNSILNILSHDLASPLANIQALSLMLQSELESDEKQEIKHIISIIEKSSKQGIQLIQEFIKQEFLESSSVNLVKERVNLVEKLQVVMEDYRQNPQLMGKHFTFNTTSDVIYLSMDTNKLMQAVNNLLSNALKFTPDDGEITVSLEEKGESIIISVADTGIGIPQKYHDTLFDKFTNARRTGIKGEPSVGLGMSIIKTIVDWHNGKIWFKSQENKGTTFYIEVPKTEIT